MTRAVGWFLLVVSILVAVPAMLVPRAGDALPLMRAVKAQFDPKNTLNPGRFVGGI